MGSGYSAASATTNISLESVSKSLYKRHQDERDEVRRKIDEIDYREYEYPFENFVFKGGGAKGQVYIGCLEVLLLLFIYGIRIAHVHPAYVSLLIKVVL